MGESIKMFSVNGGMETGLIKIVSSDNGGLSNDQISEMAVDKIVAVSETAPEPIRQQAQAFSDNVRNVVHYHIELARREERATICHKLREAGHPDLADTIRRI
jgi:hypothetical protein|tara:strand:+ start:12 stop:320 length:309 start_codon:yes stop_codon:yes gene_type:complete